MRLSRSIHVEQYVNTTLANLLNDRDKLMKMRRPADYVPQTEEEMRKELQEDEEKKEKAKAALKAMTRQPTRLKRAGEKVTASNRLSGASSDDLTAPSWLKRSSTFKGKVVGEMKKQGIARRLSHEGSEDGAPGATDEGEQGASVLGQLGSRSRTSAGALSSSDKVEIKVVSD